MMWPLYVDYGHLSVPQKSAKVLLTVTHYASSTLMKCESLEMPGICE